MNKETGMFCHRIVYFHTVFKVHETKYDKLKETLGHILTAFKDIVDSAW